MTDAVSLRASRTRRALLLAACASASVGRHPRPASIPSTPALKPARPGEGKSPFLIPPL